MAKVKLELVRLSFPALFEAEQFDGRGAFAYKATFLFEPNSANHKKLVAAMNEVAEKEWPKDFKKVLEAAADDSKLRFIGKGDSKSYDGYAGMLYVSSKRDQSKGHPWVADKNKEPLTQIDGKPYAGCYVNATIEVWAQSNRYGKTVRAQLLGVQFAKDGDAFGSGSAQASPDDFEDLSDTGAADDLIA